MIYFSRNMSSPNFVHQAFPAGFKMVSGSPTLRTKKLAFVLFLFHDTEEIYVQIRRGRRVAS
jgi:hypothetical protein